MEGYLSPARSGHPIKKGWLNTGDRGHLSAGGYLTLAGRAKELITHYATGTRVYPQIIEEALPTYPGVRAQPSAPSPTPKSTATVSTPPSPT